MKVSLLLSLKYKIPYLFHDTYAYKLISLFTSNENLDVPQTPSLSRPRTNNS